MLEVIHMILLALYSNHCYNQRETLQKRWLGINIFVNFFFKGKPRQVMKRKLLKTVFPLSELVYCVKITAHVLNVTVKDMNALTVL